jgi:hypothetical protein
MEDNSKIISSFYVKDTLNPVIWDDYDKKDESKLKSNIRDGLIRIANEFINFLDVEVFVHDITMTGSLANYNWSEFSDIDLHIIYNSSDIDEGNTELYSQLFGLKKTVFNSQHDITVKDYEVELYMQDLNELHMSTGVYSVLYDEWLVSPKVEKPEINKSFIQRKAEQWMDVIDTLEDDIKDDDLNEKIDKIDKLKEKIKKYRSCGLERGGEYSNENMVFKYLRRNGYIQKLFDLKIKSMDDSLTINENL